MRPLRQNSFCTGPRNSRPPSLTGNVGLPAINPKTLMVKDLDLSMLIASSSLRYICRHKKCERLLLRRRPQQRHMACSQHSRIDLCHDSHHHAKYLHPQKSMVGSPLPTGSAHKRIESFAAVKTVSHSRCPVQLCLASACIR